MISYRCNLCRIESPESIIGPLFPVKFSGQKKLVVESGANAHLCQDCIIAVKVLAESKFGERTLTMGTT